MLKIFFKFCNSACEIRVIHLNQDIFIRVAERGTTNVFLFFHAWRYLVELCIYADIPQTVAAIIVKSQSRNYEQRLFLERNVFSSSFTLARKPFASSIMQI